MLNKNITEIKDLPKKESASIQELTAHTETAHNINSNSEQHMFDCQDCNYSESSNYSTLLFEQCKEPHMYNPNAENNKQLLNLSNFM